MAVRVSVEREMCSGTGLCTRICPEVFELRDGYSTVLLAVVPEELAPAAREAAHLCPLQAITISG